MELSKFGKSIGKIGVSQANKKTIPMEVTLDDGSFSFNVSDVLNKWRNDLNSLFNGSGQVTDNDENTGSNMTDDASNRQRQQKFNQHISIFEVKKAIDSAKTW